MDRDPVISLAQKQPFVNKIGLFCLARQRKHIRAILLQTPSLSSVPTASIFHMQQINFTFAAGIPFRDQRLPDLLCSAFISADLL